MESIKNNKGVSNLKINLKILIFVMGPANGVVENLFNSVKKINKKT